jgi:23S rRNA (cytosine1962-C5)-methyltransferase
LVVDRYGDVLVVQISTAGMERLRTEVVTALEKVLRPTAILLRNDGSIRALEGLEAYVEPVLGPVPDLVTLSEHGTRFEVPLLEGQKTGWFFDQRQNRERMRRYVAGRRVLDLFSYLGAWGLQAAAAGAEAVLCVDTSRPALERLQANAALNGLQAQVQTQCADVFEALRALRAERERFDVVILDPPAFIKRKKDLQEGLTAYRRLNQMAMQLLARDAILISNSCSYHLPREALQQLMLTAARHLDRSLQVLEQGHQGPDHPVHPAIAETDYLKAVFGRVLPA